MPIHVRSKRRAAPLPAETAAAIQPGGELPFGLPRPSPSRVQKPPGISLCMIVKNEERFLRQCLDSVKDVVDEMIVVDTGSTDTTMEIARSYGAHVIQRPWRDDFAWARNQALEAATKRWILVLDADEELLVESIPALRQLKTVPAEHTALWARLHNKSDDYRGTGAMSHALIRVFPNTPEIRYKGLIHEYPTVSGNRDGLKGMTSPVTIVHHGYVKEIVNAREKGARNLAMVRAATEQEPEEAFNWFNLGSTAFMVNDYETARDALERMRSMVGKERRGFMPNGLAVLAETYCDKMDDPVRGEEVARHALEIAPHYANAHFQLGKALVAQGRLDEARDAYLAAIDDERYAAEQFVLDDQVYVWKAHSEIGSTYVIDKNDEKALEWFEKGLKNAPNAEPLHVNRARALERLGRLDEAGSAYRAVYEL
ncbi:MAG: glycosyltransferase, partial [Candidatus Eremiobacteraeota bacterium]|nr:glycosyltransferase [Candidatus Eremiobacteraeota bacterium]